MQLESYARVHDGGRMVCAVSPNGRYMITCGADGCLNKYTFGKFAAPTELDDPSQTHDLPFFDISFSSQGDFFVTACEDGEASLYMFPTCTSQSTPVRFDSPCTSAQFQPKRSSCLIAAASESGKIRCLDALQPTASVLEWVADPDGVRSIRWDPSGDILAVAGSDGKLSIFRFESLAEKPSLVTSSKPFPKIRGISSAAQRLVMDFHPQGSLLALPGQMDVVLLKCDDWTEAHSLSGQHHHPTSVMKFSPCGRFLLSGDVSGKAIVWQLQNDLSAPPSVVEMVQLFIPESENSESQDMLSQFQDIEPSGIGCAGWSKDSTTIVLTDCAGNMFEWKPSLGQSQQALSSSQSTASCPTTLPYSLDDNTSSQGSTHSDNQGPKEVTQKLGAVTLDEQPQNDPPEDDNFDLDMDIDEGDDFGLVGSSRKLIRRKKRTNFGSDSESDNEEKASQEKGNNFFTSGVVLDEAEENDDDFDATPKPAQSSNQTQEPTFDMSLSIDDLLKAEAAAEKAQAVSQVQLGMGDDVDDVVMEDIEDDPLAATGAPDDVLDDFGTGNVGVHVAQVVDDDRIRSVFLRHTPFQSGNTPYDESRQRYLAWNEIGAVIGREDSSSSFGGSFTVEIDFCDKSLYSRSVRFRETRTFDVAALGSESIFLGSRGNTGVGDDRAPFLRFHGFQTSWCGQVDWRHALPDSEGVCCVGVTSNYAVAATSMQFVRIFSKGGMQIAILSLPGDPITIASSLATETVAIAFETVTGLKVWVLDLERQKRTYEGNITLSADSVLTWLYFGPNDILLTVDTNNIMRALTRCFDWTWVPVLDLAAGVVNHLEQEQEDMHIQVDIENCGVRPICFDYVEGYDPALMTVILKPGEEQPSCSERPILVPIPLQIPALGMSFDVDPETGEPKPSFGADEEAILRKDVMYQMGDRTNTMAMAQKFKKERVKSSVVLFQRACEMKRQCLALDIARMYLTSKKALLAASKIAMHSSMNRLAEQINGLLRKREAERTERLEQESLERELMYGRETSIPEQDNDAEMKTNSPEVTPPGTQQPSAQPQQTATDANRNTFSFGRTNSLGGRRNRKRRLEGSGGPDPKRHQTVPFASNSNPQQKKQRSTLFDL